MSLCVEKQFITVQVSETLTYTKMDAHLHFLHVHQNGVSVWRLLVYPVPTMLLSSVTQ